MRALKIVGWVVIGIAGIAAIGLVLGLPVMWLWNWLMPSLFGFPVVSFWQSVGLLVLCHLLFKGHHPGHHRRGGCHGQHRHHARWHDFACRVKGALDDEPARPVAQGDP